MFRGLKNIFSSLYTKISNQFQSLFSRNAVDENTIKEIEKILLEADAGTRVTKKITQQLHDAYRKGTLTKGTDIKTILEQELIDLLSAAQHQDEFDVYLLVGINGSGKTTAIGKLSALFHEKGKKVLIVAADTFRAAATEQLASWAQKTDADIVTGSPGQDPASVVFAGAQQFQSGSYDVLLIDTAGRLQTKINLMKELEKIKRVLHKALPHQKGATLLTIDAMLGQNSFEQARIFHESTKLDGIILTKTDGTAKGGIIFAIVDEFKIPIMFFSYGEQPEQFRIFDPITFVKNMLS